VVLALVAARLGTTGGLSGALAGTRERRSDHDPRRLFCDLAVVLADGGRCVSDPSPSPGWRFSGIRTVAVAVALGCEVMSEWMTGTNTREAAGYARGTRSNTRLQSVSRAVRILLYVAQAEQPPSAKEVAKSFGLAQPTAYHVLNTLTAEEMLIKDDARRYRVGPQIGVLSDAFLRELTVPEHLLMPLRDLADATGETTYMSAWRGSRIVVLASVEGAHAIRVPELHSGFSADPHARASGKVLLAFATPHARDLYLGSNELTPRTPNTITDPDKLRKELVRIRRRGYGFDDEELEIGIAGVAAPVLRGDLVMATYTVTAPADRFRRRRKELTEAVLKVARSASDT
jgi:DNA-binding IclR family transcriptional regulator